MRPEGAVIDAIGMKLHIGLQALFERFPQLAKLTPAKPDF